MRRSQRLELLVRQLDRRLGRLLALAREEENRTSPKSRRLVSYVAIEAVSAWNTFCREYYLACVLLEPFTRSHTKVVHNASGTILNERTALIEAIRRNHKPRFNPDVNAAISSRDEPDWKSKGVLLKLSGSLQFSNHGQIVNAFSYRTTALSDLPSVRNFFAHRDRNAAERIRELARYRYNTPYLSHPAELINSILTARTDTLLAQWISDFRYLGASLAA